MKINTLMNRREFLIKSAFGGAGLAFANTLVSGKSLSVIGANDRLRVGVIGLGSRGTQHLGHFLSLPNIEIAALCDTQEKILNSSIKYFEKGERKPPLKMTDYRRLLDLKDLDAVSIAVPRGIRASCGIEAISAGKHVLFEKPFSSTISEGQNLLSVAKNTNQLIQQRDDNYFVSEDNIFTFGGYSSIGNIKQITGLKNINQQNLSEFLPEQVLDELDFSRCMLKSEIPNQVKTFGSLSFQNGLPLKCAIAQFEFTSKGGDRKSISFEIKTPSNSDEKDYGQHSYSLNEENFQSEIKALGTRGEVSIKYDTKFGKPTTRANFANFIDSIRNRNANGLINPIDEARKSNMLIQLMELSFKYKRNIKFDPEIEKVIDDEQLNKIL